MGTALGLGVVGLSTQYATYAVQTNPGALPGGVWAAWVISWAWVAVIVPMVTFLFLLFPDGHVPSRRWRPVAWVAGLLLLDDLPARGRSSRSAGCTGRLERLENQAAESRIEQATLRQHPLEVERARCKAIVTEIESVEARLRTLLADNDHDGAGTA